MPLPITHHTFTPRPGFCFPSTLSKLPFWWLTDDREGQGLWGSVGQWKGHRARPPRAFPAVSLSSLHLVCSPVGRKEHRKLSALSIADPSQPSPSPPPPATLQRSSLSHTIQRYSPPYLSPACPRLADDSAQFPQHSLVVSLRRNLVPTIMVHVLPRLDCPHPGDRRYPDPITVREAGTTVTGAPVNACHS